MSVDDVEAGVLAEHFGHDDALGRLIVLEQRGHDARQGQGRAVEGMTEMCLLVLAAVTALEAVGLIGLEIGYRRNLEPALLCGRPYLEVEGDGRCERHVAAAQAQDVPGQPELVEQALNMVLHLLKSGIRIFGLLDTYDLDLVELVQTVEAAYVLAVRSGLAAEAGRLGAVLDRKLVGRQDHVAVEVSDRHLGGGDQVEVVERHDIHLGLLVGELPCAVTRSLVDHVGRLHLEITGLRGLVEEELDQRALELGSLAEIYREAGTGDLDAELEVDQVVLFGQFPMGKGVGRQVGHRAAGLLDHIVGGSLAFGHHVAGHVGHVEQDVADVVLCLGELVGKILLGCLDVGNSSLGLLGESLLAGLHMSADRGGELVELGCHIVILQLQSAAVVVELDYAGYGLASVKALDRQARDDALGVGLDLLHCEHNSVSFFRPLPASVMILIGLFGQKLLYLGRDGAAFGAAGERFGGDAHHLAHVGGRRGTDLRDDLLQLGLELSLGELLGQIFLDDGYFGQLAFGQIGTVLLRVDACAFAALLGHAGHYGDGSGFRELAARAGSRLCLDEFFLDAAERFESHFVPGKHSLFDVVGDSFE